jgi:hypothetical protein
MLGIAILSGGDAVIVAVSGVFLNWGLWMQLRPTKKGKDNAEAAQIGGDMSVEKRMALLVGEFA